MTGLDLSQTKQFVIRPTLALFPPRWNTDAAVNLLAGTMLVESSGVYLAQLGGGPAIGVCQMEPATHDDCWANFLAYQPELKLTILEFLSPQPRSELDALHGNLFYAFAMARVKYIRAPTALPAANDALGLANYHKLVYNTAGGATVVDESVRLFQQAIES